MEELYSELYRLCGKIARETDPNRKWELELEIENVHQEILEGSGMA